MEGIYWIERVGGRGRGWGVLVRERKFRSKVRVGDNGLGVDGCSRVVGWLWPVVGVVVGSLLSRGEGCCGQRRLPRAW